MRPSVYIETTIPSYLTAWESKEVVRAAHQQLTKAWWEQRREHFTLYISQIVLDEASAGDADAARERIQKIADLPLLPVTQDVATLASKIIEEAQLPPKAVTDAAHMAVACIHQMDFLLTWNCNHINNAQLLPKIEKACRIAGYICPVICTPEELMGI